MSFVLIPDLGSTRRSHQGERNAESKHDKPGEDGKGAVSKDSMFVMALMPGKRIH